MRNNCSLMKKPSCVETRCRVTNRPRTSAVLKTFFVLLVACLYGLPSFADQAEDNGRQFKWTDENGVTWTYTAYKVPHEGKYTCNLNAVSGEGEVLVVPDSLPDEGLGAAKVWYKVVNTSLYSLNNGASKIIDFSGCKHLDGISFDCFNGWENLEQAILPTNFKIGISGYNFNNAKFKGFSIGEKDAGFTAGSVARTTNGPSEGNLVAVSGMLYWLDAQGNAMFCNFPKGWVAEDGQGVQVKQIYDNNNHELTTGVSGIWDIENRAFTQPDRIFDGTEWHNVTSYETYAFNSGKQLKTLTLSSNINTTEIPGVESTLEAVHIDSPTFKDQNGVVFSRDGSKLVIFPAKKVPGKTEGTTLGKYVVPESVTRIDKSCFHHVDSLFELDLSRCHIDSLFEGTFYGCSHLKELSCSRYIRDIGHNITYSTGIEKFVLLPEDDSQLDASKPIRYWTGRSTDNLNTYGVLYSAKDATGIERGDTLFEYPSCHVVENSLFFVPDNITVIAACACKYGRAFNTLSLPSTLKEIHTDAFGHFGDLSSVVFRDSENSQLEFIGGGAFAPSGLTSFTLPKSVKKIDSNGAFADCTNLTSFIIPEGSSLESIGTGIFEGCTALENLDLQYSKITSIPVRAFRKTDLHDLTFPATLRKIEDNAFNNEDNISLVEAGGTPLSIHFLGEHLDTIGTKAFKNVANLEEIDLSKQQLKYIGDYAFMGSGLKKVLIPASVESLGHHAFMCCPQIDSINVDSGNPHYISVKGVLYAKSRGSNNKVIIKKLLSYPSGRSSDKYDFQYGPDGERNCYTILPSIKEIGDSAFYGCELLEDLKLPPSIEKIGNWAFLYCKRLKNLSIMSAEMPKINEYPGSPIVIFDNSISTIGTPTLIVREGALEAYQNNHAWDGFTRKFTSFTESTTGVEYFPWSETRVAATNSAKTSNSMAMDDVSNAKSGSFAIDDKGVNANGYGFSEQIDILAGADSYHQTFHYDKVAVMGIKDAAESTIAKTFIIPPYVDGTIGGHNSRYKVTAIADSAFYNSYLDEEETVRKYPHLYDITMQGNPEYIGTSAFVRRDVRVYFPNYDGITKPLASKSFISPDTTYSNGNEFSKRYTTVFLRKSLCTATSTAQLYSPYLDLDLEDDTHSVVTYKIPVAVNKVASSAGGANSGYYAGTFCREFDVDFSDCEATCSPLLFWVMKGYKISVTDKDEQDAGIKHYYKAWSFPSTGDNAQKLQLKAGDGVLVRVTANPDDLYCTFYEKEKNGNKELKAIAEFGNPDATSTEEGINTQALAPNALVGVYARTYMAGKDGRNFSKGYKNFAVHPDGTPTGNTNNVDCGYIMGWKTAENAGCFVLVNYDYQDKDNKNSQFTAFKAFLGTGITEEADITTQNGKQAQFLMIWDGDMSTVTDVRSIFTENAEEEGGAYYTVSGQRVEKPTAKGLYIHNGKKVLVK